MPTNVNFSKPFQPKKKNNNNTNNNQTVAFPAQLTDRNNNDVWGIRSKSPLRPNTEVTVRTKSKGDVTVTVIEYQGHDDGYHYATVEWPDNRGNNAVNHKPNFAR